jgi:hypothetical protein
MIACTLPDLNTVSNVASILTALIAAVASLLFWRDRRSKRTRLERYLKREKATNPSQCCHTVIHLMAKLGLTEEEILHASFCSRHIIHKSRKDADTDLATQLLFEYSETPKKQ